MSEGPSSVPAKISWPRPFAGLRGVTLAEVPREVSAGVTLAALMIPLNIGYAQVAGLPPVAGLYAAIIPLLVFALLTSSRHLVTSPDASMAGLVGAALVAFAAPRDRQRLQHALALAVVCGVAFLANFLSLVDLIRRASRPETSALVEANAERGDPYRRAGSREGVRANPCPFPGHHDSASRLGGEARHHSAPAQEAGARRGSPGPRLVVAESGVSHPLR